jgi:hypothetical protein
MNYLTSTVIHESREKIGLYSQAHIDLDSHHVTPTHSYMDLGPLVWHKLDTTTGLGYNR